MATVSEKLTEDVRFERATGTIGAWVQGIGLGITASAATAQILRRGLAEHGVLFFDFGRVPSSSEFTEFAQLFGEVEAAYGQKVANQTQDVPYIDSDRAPMKEHHQNWWHSDGAPLERPPLAALLTPFELPEAGGDTMWSSMYAAWDALSPHYQRLLEGLEALNSNVRVPFLEPRQCTHPAVLRDPITGRKSLYVNSIYTERFIGLTDKENDSLLRMIFDHVNTPEFHVRLRWRLGVAAVWHQRVTQHRGVNDFVGPRKLKRLTIVGDRPSA
jgi:taurine dioxygenase